MLPEQAPRCACGEKKWQGGGGHIGPGLAVTALSCEACGARGYEVSGYARLYVVFDKEHEDDVVRYLNETVLVQWRAAEAAGEEVQLPAKIPDYVLATYVWSQKDRDWVEVSPQATQDVAVPPDPIEVEHFRFWNSVRAALEIKDAEVTKNQYDGAGNEPWFTWEWGGATVTAGPRKRVYAVKVERHEPFDVKAIAALAKADNVTYCADDGWQNWDQPAARRLEVHAWNEERLLEYLTAIRESLRTGAGGEEQTARPEEKIASELFVVVHRAVGRATEALEQVKVMAERAELSEKETGLLMQSMTEMMKVGTDALMAMAVARVREEAATDGG